MTEHVEFRDYQPQDVTKISFGSPGSFAERMDMVGSVGRVAVWRGEIVGYAVTWLALVHRTRRFVEVEVAPNSRGHQIGTRLLDQVAEASDRPLAVKAIEGSDVEEFYLERGARPYAVCPPLELLRRSFEKVVNRLGPADDVVAGSTLAPGTVELLWSQIYTWTHEEWSPVDDSDEARAAIASEARELDLDRTAVALVDGEPAAVAFVFDDPGASTVCAESVRRDTPDADEALTRAVAWVVRDAHGRSEHRLAFDGHESDPHFGPLARRLCLEGARLSLLEIPVPSRADS